MSVITVAALLLAFLVLLIVWKTLNRKRAMRLPPMAAGGLPIVGHSLLLLSNRKRLYQVITNTILDASLKKGMEVVTIRCGTSDLYVVMNPDDAYLVANSCLTKDVFYKFFKPLMGDAGLVTADVPIWNRHRKLINPKFNQSILDSYLREFNNQSRELVKDLAQKEGKESFDQMPSVKHTILQLVLANMVGFNVDEEDLKKKFAEAIEIYKECVMERIRTFWCHNDFLFSYSNIKRKHYAAAKILHKMGYQVISDYLDASLKGKKISEFYREGKANECKDTSRTKFKSFCDLLLDMSKEGALKESEIEEEMYTFIGAAFDTTSHTLGIIILTIGTYPEVQQKIFNELQEIFRGSDRDVEKKDLSKLIYLEAVIKETMRLYPVIFITGRTLDRELHFKNCSVPAGSRCFLSNYSICRHPVWGPDAEKFRPERWLDGSLPSNPRAYAVFGLGKRSCIGSNYAMMSMKTVLAHVVRRYNISGDVTQLVLKADIVCSMLSGHHISIKRREE